jgi:hypothetical protein
MNEDTCVNAPQVTESASTAAGNCTWYVNTIDPYVYGRAYWYAYPTLPERSQRAYDIVKALSKAKLLKLDTAKQFMEAMDAVIEVL